MNSFDSLPKNVITARRWKIALEIEPDFNVKGHVCINHFEDQYLNKTSATIKLRIGAVPSIFALNDSNDTPECESMNDINVICACSSECEKISLVKQIKELRGKIVLRDSENAQLKKKYSIAIQALAKRNAESRRKMIYNRIKISRLQETKRKLIVQLNELKKKIF